MIQVGWFGKTPDCKEYVGKGLNGKLPLWLRNWVESGHDLFVSRLPERRGKIFKKLKFIVIDHKGDDCLVGVMAESTDSIGRMFPMTAFVQVPLSVFSEPAYLPVLAGPIWRLLENTDMEKFDIVKEQIEDWHQNDQLKILPRNRAYIDGLIGSLSLSEFLRLSGVANPGNVQKLLGLKSVKTGKEMVPWCVKGPLPAEKTLFFLCLWYLITKNVSQSLYFPHCFMSGSEGGFTEFALFFRWPIKLDFLLLQGLDAVSEYNIDLSGISNNKGSSVKTVRHDILEMPLKNLFA